MTDTGMLGVENWFKLLYLGLSACGIVITVSLSAIWLRPRPLVELMERGVVFRWFVQAATTIIPILIMFGSIELYRSLSRLSFDLLRAQGNIFAELTALQDSMAKAAFGFGYMMIAAVMILICALATLSLPPVIRPLDKDDTKSGKDSNSE